MKTRKNASNLVDWRLLTPFQGHRNSYRGRIWAGAGPYRLMDRPVQRPAWGSLRGENSVLRTPSHVKVCRTNGDQGSPRAQSLFERKFARSPSCGNKRLVAAIDLGGCPPAQGTIPGTVLHTVVMDYLLGQDAGTQSCWREGVAIADACRLARANASALTSRAPQRIRWWPSRDLKPAECHRGPRKARRKMLRFRTRISPSAAAIRCGGDTSVGNARYRRLPSNSKIPLTRYPRKYPLFARRRIVWVSPNGQEKVSVRQATKSTSFSRVLSCRRKT